MTGEPMNDPMPRGPTTRPAVKSRIAEDFLIVERQDGDSDVDAHPQQSDQEASCAEVTVLQHVQVDQALGIESTSARSSR